jgi:hypothetical protein
MSGSQPRPARAPLKPTSDDPRLAHLIERQEVEGFDIRTLDAYHTALSSPVDRYAVETAILVLRLSRWALDKSLAPDWKSLDDEYGGEDMVYDAVSMPGEPHGTDLLMRALSSIIGWKAWNYPRLGTDLFAYTMVVEDMREGATMLAGSPYELDVNPSLLVVMSSLLARAENETGWTVTQLEGELSTDKVGRILESEGRDRIPSTPEAGYGSSMARVINWYTNMAKPLQDLGAAMSTPSYLLESLSKNEFIARLAPNLEALADLPPMLEIISSLAYGEGFVLGRYTFQLEDQELTSYTFKSQRNEPFNFKVSNSDTAVTERVQMRPRQFYATLIDYVLSVMTPGVEDPTWFGDGDTFWETAWLGPGE